METWPFESMEKAVLVALPIGVVVERRTRGVVVPKVCAIESWAWGVVVPIPILPKELMRNWLIPWFLRFMKFPVKPPMAEGLVEVEEVARSMRRPVPANVPDAWVMERREVVASSKLVVPMV